MAYAILQKELHPPEPGSLQRAFASLPHLTRHDALAVGRDAHGVLMRGLEAAQAEAMLEALQREEVGVEMVAEAHLPSLPESKVIRALRWQDESMILEDPMRRTYRLGAADLTLIAAGLVRVHEFRRERNLYEAPGLHAPGVSRDTISGVRARETTRETLMLKLLAFGGTQCFSILAEELDFGFLAAERTDDAATNLALLVSKLKDFAPEAGLNRGAWHLSRAADDWIRYPSRNAFLEELTWILWRAGRSNGAVTA
jgi:hypothetical protein